MNTDETLDTMVNPELLAGFAQCGVGH